MASQLYPTVLTFRAPACDGGEFPTGMDRPDTLCYATDLSEAIGDEVLSQGRCYNELGGLELVWVATIDRSLDAVINDIDRAIWTWGAHPVSIYGAECGPVTVRGDITEELLVGKLSTWGSINPETTNTTTLEAS